MGSTLGPHYMVLHLSSFKLDGLWGRRVEEFALELLTSNLVMGPFDSSGVCFMAPSFVSGIYVHMVCIGAFEANGKTLLCFVVLIWSL